MNGEECSLECPQPAWRDAVRHKERRQHLKQKPFEQNNGQLAGMLHRVKPIVILCSILNVVKAKIIPETGSSDKKKSNS